MIAAGATMTLESWDIKYKDNLDWNHAWGAAPGNIIPRYLMGIQPAEAGFKKVLIQPHPGLLNRAKITVPTIRGAIKVSFEKHNQSDYDFILELPANTTARFVLPAKKTYTQVILDGAPNMPQTSDAKQFIDAIGSGRHTIICR
jgi:alpha-L-rhamnosidase